MAAPKMHADEIDTDVALVRRLLAGQFPQWAGLAIDPVMSYGTDHDIYRLGGHFAVRLPRIGWATGQAEHYQLAVSGDSRVERSMCRLDIE